jgi:transcriptional regulator with XRE-family HTH domain
VRLPPSLLSESERRAFAPWLKSAIQQSGKTKTEFARALGDDSTERLNRYLNGRIPTKRAIRKIAAVLALPYAVLCLRAGYFEELLEPIGILAFLALETRKRLYAAAAIVIVFACFPSAGVRVTGTGMVRAAAILEWIFDLVSELESKGRMKTKRPLPGVFGAISRILRESRLDARDRREVAALLLGSFARKLDPDMADSVQADLADNPYQKAVQIVADQLSSSTKEK